MMKVLSSPSILLVTLVTQLKDDVLATWHAGSVGLCPTRHDGVRSIGLTAIAICDRIKYMPKLTF